VKRLSLLILFFALPSSAEAENDAPKWLLGKSVVLQYTEARSFEPAEPGRGWTHEDTVDSRAIVYISDRGRIFAQAQRTVATARGNRSFSLTKSPDITSPASDWRFDGETLLGLTKHGEDRSSTVKRVAVRFRPDSQICTILVTYARPQGSGTVLMEGWSGDYYYLRRYELTSSTCEVKAGNAFDSAH
jgi:hypothetical protein